MKTVPIRGKRANDDCPVLKEKLDDYRSITMNLGSRTMQFREGQWVHDQRQSGSGGDDNNHDVTVLKRQMKKLEQINNLSQIKIDVLLDMMTKQRLNESNKTK